MKKRNLKSTLFVVACFAAGFGCYNARAFVERNTPESSLILENVEAQSMDLWEYWNRKDYVCKTVTCRCLLYSYQSDVAERVADGQGTVAHTWNCTGCGDCGWT